MRDLNYTDSVVHHLEAIAPDQPLHIGLQPRFTPGLPTDYRSWTILSPSIYMFDHACVPKTKYRIDVAESTPDQALIMFWGKLRKTSHARTVVVVRADLSRRAYVWNGGAYVEIPVPEGFEDAEHLLLDSAAELA